MIQYLVLMLLLDTLSYVTAVLVLLSVSITISQRSTRAMVLTITLVALGYLRLVLLEAAKRNTVNWHFSKSHPINFSSIPDQLPGQ